MATLPRSGAVIPACLRRASGGPVDLTVSHTGVATAGPEQEVGGSWVGMKPAGEQSICCCLPCWSLELESWQKAPEMQVETGRAGDSVSLCWLGSPAPVLGPSCPLSQAGACLLPAATPATPPTPPPPRPGPLQESTRLLYRPGVACPPAWLASGFLP